MTHINLVRLFALKRLDFQSQKYGMPSDMSIYSIRSSTFNWSISSQYLLL